LYKSTTVLCNFAHRYYFKSFLRKKGRKNRLKEGADVNEGKFVLNIDFIMALKPDGLCVYETTKQAAYNFSVSL
jgi:hypothetical protein